VGPRLEGGQLATVCGRQVEDENALALGLPAAYDNPERFFRHSCVFPSVGFASPLSA